MKSNIFKHAKNLLQNKKWKICTGIVFNYSSKILQILKIKKNLTCNNNRKSEVIWLEVEEVDLNDDFVELFAKTTITTKNSKQLKQTNNTKEVAKLLESKRAQTIGIFINSHRLDVQTIKDALINYNSKILDYETLNSIYSIRPQDDEIKIIQDYVKSNNEENLDKPEHFFLELSRIPAFEERIYCLVYQNKFNESISSIEFRLNNVKAVCDELLHNEKIKKLLGIILACGNNMNANNKSRGDADGFDLAILPNLRDVKSKDNSTTLLQYIAYYYVNKIDDSSNFPLLEPSDLSFSANVSFHEIDKEIKRVENELKDVNTRAEAVFKSTEESTHEPFKKNIEKFLKEANDELKEQQVHLSDCQKAFKTTVNFFSLKPKPGETEVTPEYFFLLWLRLCQEFKDLWKRELQKLSKQR